MRFSTPLLVLGLATFLAPAPCTAQTPDAERWQISLGPDQVLWDVRLVKLVGDSLEARRGDSIAVVPVAKITELRLIRKSEVAMDNPAGGAMAALMGTDDEVYDLTTLDFADRLRAVQKIFLYHPPDSTAGRP